MKLHFSSFIKNTFLNALIKSFLTAYALCVVFHSPLAASHYETTLDFAIASIYEFLGVYDLKFMVLWLLSFCFYNRIEELILLSKFYNRIKKPILLSKFYYCGFGKNTTEEKYCKSFSVFLPVFFAFCLLLGQSYYETDTSVYCFGSIVNFLHFVFALAGYSFLFHSLLNFLYHFLLSHTFAADGNHFFTQHAFWKAFFILLGAYVPFLLLSFPGQLCWDAVGQIEQVIGNTDYSTHHPLFHTLIMGGLVKAGQSLFHSADAGLFVYMLLQAVALASALAATIAVLSKREAKFSLLLSLLLLYCITPIYSNLASTAVKDVPYSAAVLGYTICLGLFLENPDRVKNKKFVSVFLLLQISVILLRNNGLYVILLSGIGCFIFLFRKMGKKQRISLLFSLFGGSFLISRMILFLLVWACSASSGSIGEMLSIPFQQTARYLQLYREEASAEERAGIEGVLGDLDKVAASYNPDSSDPVKALYNKNASGLELTAYFKSWFKGFLKAPASYFEAFFLHIYGWFTPSVSNSIRYEIDGDFAISQTGLFPDAQKILIFYYRFAARFTPLGFLENIGVYVWSLFFLTFYQKRRHWTTGVFAGLPLWISLLICMASPCFFNHPRYAFPILLTLPFLYGFTLTSRSCITQNLQK